MLAGLIIGLGYLLGSIPFGLLLTRAAGLGDIRNMGSGNIGATNVLRTGNRGLALATLLLDGGKGAAAVLLARQFGASEMLVLGAALAVLLGHIFPVWLRFAGGKGVATFIGVLLALNWPVALAVIGTWLLVAALFRMSSLAALSAAALAPLFCLAVANLRYAGAVGVMAALIFWRHRENIQRIFAGSEPKLGSTKPVIAN